MLHRTLAVGVVIPDNKGFHGFKKRRSSLAFLKVQFWFLNHLLKWKECQLDPILFGPLLPWGDKGFRGFIKGQYWLVYLKDQFSFLNHLLKWKDF